MASQPHVHDFPGVHVRLLGTRVLLAVALGFLGASRGAAQERPEPRLLLSAFGGVAGGRHLWAVNRQPLFVLGTVAPARYDTLRLSRDIRPGLVLGFAGTLFPSPSLGITGEIVFLGLSTDDHCSVTFENTVADPLGRNATLCADIDAHSVSPTTVGFYAGATYRAFPRGFASPYARAEVGIATRSGSTVEMEGAYLDAGPVVRRRAVIVDPAGKAPVPSAGVAFGVMIPVAAGHQARLEIRDHLIIMRRVTGVADALAIAPTSTVLAHSIALTAGVDIVLERKRGRRY